MSDDSPDYDVHIDADELLADLVEQAQDYAEDHTEKREWWHDSFDSATEWTEARYWMLEALGGLEATDQAIAALQPGAHTIHAPNCRNDDGTVDVETVTNLSADVVLAANVTKSGTIDQLRSAGTTVYHFGEVQSMEETYRNVNRTGQIVGSCGAAADRVAAMQERLDRIQQAVADRDEPRVLYLFYGYTAGDDTHINSMIEIAGGENVAASAGLTSYQPISEEVVVVNDPQWIVQPSDAPPAAGAPYNDTTALQQGQVLQVNTNYANQAGPRVVNVVERMAQSFHPAAFDENGDPIVDRTQTEAPSSTETPMDSTTTDTPTPQTTTTAADGPGFSGLIALVGLLGAIVFLGVRRKGV